MFENTYWTRLHSPITSVANGSVTVACLHCGQITKDGFNDCQPCPPRKEQLLLSQGAIDFMERQIRSA